MDDGTRPEPQALVIERSFDAPRALLFKVWTDPAHMARWWGCDYMTNNKIVNDLRVGGDFESKMTLADGSNHIISGRYLEIDAPARLKFTWTWVNGDQKGSDSIVTVDLKEDGDATRMTLRHERFATVEECDSHREGWTASVDRLAQELANGFG